MQGTDPGECRQCASWCDKLVEPRGCRDMGCTSLYTYRDTASGRLFMGCLHKVFGAEIDVDLFEACERTRPGFGGVKMTGAPLPHCPFRVEQAYEGDSAEHRCVNPRFFDCTDEGELGLRVRDLRDVLADG